MEAEQLKQDLIEAREAHQYRKEQLVIAAHALDEIAKAYGRSPYRKSQTIERRAKKIASAVRDLWTLIDS